MRYQLVLQFEASSLDDFDRLIAVEEILVGELGGSVEIDGHDFGQSQLNIFVLTNEPAITFELAHRLLDSQRLKVPFRAAYREIDGTAYVVLWPSHLSEFTIA